MDENGGHMMEKVLNLALELIYLLTGESFPTIKSGDRVTITVPLPSSLKHNRSINKKVLEVTNEIIELLTGEVPIRCQDVSVYFSMEEWEYVEGHKDLYKDIVMMEDQPPLTSSDKSSDRNPPESCPSPLVSHDSTQEDLTVPHRDQGEDLMLNIKVKDEDEEDEPFNIHYQQYKEEDTSGTSADGEMDDGDLVVVVDPEESTFTPNFHSGPLSLNQSLHPSGQHLERQPLLTGGQQYENLFPCTLCGKLFRSKSYLVVHQRTHTGEKPFLCSLCGKCFTQNSTLLRHRKFCLKQEPLLLPVDRVRPSEAPDQAKRPTTEKTIPCPDCGKIFSCTWHLAEHQRIHTGEKPFSCAECGKCFSFRSSYVSHRKTHSGDKPFSCLDCGKCFTLRQYLVKHQKIHRDERPFSCVICGKTFKERSDLTKHHKVHSGEKPFACSVCGKRFSGRKEVSRHQKTHTQERPYSCSECGKCFSWRTDLLKHQRTHDRNIINTP